MSMDTQFSYNKTEARNNTQIMRKRDITVWRKVYTTLVLRLYASHLGQISFRHHNILSLRQNINLKLPLGGKKKQHYATVEVKLDGVTIQ